MFKLVVFLLFAYSTLSQELDEMPAGESAAGESAVGECAVGESTVGESAAGESAAEQEIAKFKADEASGISIEENEEVDEQEITEGSCEGKICFYLFILNDGLPIFICKPVTS